CLFRIHRPLVRAVVDEPEVRSADVGPHLRGTESLAQVARHRVSHLDPRQAEIACLELVEVAAQAVRVSSGGSFAQRRKAPGDPLALIVEGIGSTPPGPGELPPIVEAGVRLTQRAWPYVE